MHCSAATVGVVGSNRFALHRMRFNPCLKRHGYMVPPSRGSENNHVVLGKIDFGGLDLAHDALFQFFLHDFGCRTIGLRIRFNDLNSEFIGTRQTSNGVGNILCVFVLEKYTTKIFGFLSACALAKPETPTAVHILNNVKVLRLIISNPLSFG